MAFMTGAKENGVEYATYRPKVHSENRMTWDILSANPFDTGLKKGEIKWINPIQAYRCNPESSALYSSHTMRSEGEPGRIDNLNDQSVPGTLWCDRGNYYLINKRVCCVEGWGALGRRNWFLLMWRFYVYIFPVSEMEFVGRWSKGASCSAGYITNIPMHECALLTAGPAGALIIKHFQNL